MKPKFKIISDVLKFKFFNTYSGRSEFTAFAGKDISPAIKRQLLDEIERKSLISNSWNFALNTKRIISFITIEKFTIEK